MKHRSTIEQLFAASTRLTGASITLLGILVALIKIEAIANSRMVWLTALGAFEFFSISTIKYYLDILALNKETLKDVVRDPFLIGLVILSFAVPFLAYLLN